MCIKFKGFSIFNYKPCYIAILIKSLSIFCKSLRIWWILIILFCLSLILLLLVLLWFNDFLFFFFLMRHLVANFKFRIVKKISKWICLSLITPWKFLGFFCYYFNKFLKSYYIVLIWLPNISDFYNKKFYIFIFIRKYFILPLQIH